MARTKRKQLWSYSAGHYGRNRVRVFERPERGDVLLQYTERDTDGTLRPKRVTLGRCTRGVARAKADEVAARFLSAPAKSEPEPVTLQALFDIYGREVSPQKGDSKRQHDERSARMFVRFFGAERDPRTLSRREWDRFIADRRRGGIAPTKSGKGKAVGDRMVGYDLAFLRAVLNWATTASDDRGGVLLERNPLKGLTLPTEDSPVRSVIAAEQYEVLREAARNLGQDVELMLVIVHETGHRIGSVRRLRWSDIDLDRRMIRWRAENDKIGFAHETPLSKEAVELLTRAQRAQAVIGDAWVFPSPGDESKPCSRHLARDLFERLRDRAQLPKGQRYGWHSLRRKFASELKAIPLKDLAHLGGWKDPATILKCYQKPDEATQRAALEQRQTLRAGGLARR
jgi:integrase